MLKRCDQKITNAIGVFIFLLDYKKPVSPRTHPTTCFLVLPITRLDAHNCECKHLILSF